VEQRLSSAIKQEDLEILQEKVEESKIQAKRIRLLTASLKKLTEKIPFSTMIDWEWTRKGAKEAGRSVRILKKQMRLQQSVKAIRDEEFEMMRKMYSLEVKVRFCALKPLLIQEVYNLRQEIIQLKERQEELKRQSETLAERANALIVRADVSEEAKQQLESLVIDQVTEKIEKEGEKIRQIQTELQLYIVERLERELREVTLRAGRHSEVVTRLIELQEQVEMLKIEGGDLSLLVDDNNGVSKMSPRVKRRKATTGWTRERMRTMGQNVEELREVIIGTLQPEELQRVEERLNVPRQRTSGLVEVAAVGPA
jgi:hypothetical protein